MRSLYRSMVSNDISCISIIKEQSLESGVIYNFKVEDQWKRHTINVALNFHQNFNSYVIRLSGPKKNYPIVVDFRNVKVNGQIIEDNEFHAWFAKPFEIRLDSNLFSKQEKIKTVELSFEARQYHYKSGDLKNIFDFNIYIFISLAFVIYILLFLLFNNRTIFFNLFNKYCIRKQNFVFLIIVSIIIVLPLMKINNDKISVQENRKLAESAKLYISKGINNNFGKEFDSWFNDRFFGRNTYLKLSSTKDLLFNQIIQNSTAFYDAKSGWFFLKPFYKQRLSINDESLVVENINKLKQFCNDHKIKLYILLVPKKEDIYQEFLNTLNITKPQNYVDFNQSIENIKSKVGSNIIVYPRDELLKAKEKDFVFFKESHHWTDWGAYNGYRTLMHRINADLNIKEISLKDYKISSSKMIRDDYDRDFNYGHTTRLLGISKYYTKKFILKDSYSYYDINNFTFEEVRSNFIKTFKSNDIDVKYRLFLTGTSQNEDLLQFIPYSFKETKYLRLNMAQVPGGEEYKFMKYYKDELLEFNPDIMVVCIQVADIYDTFFNFFKD